MSLERNGHRTAAVSEFAANTDRFRLVILTQLFLHLFLPFLHSRPAFPAIPVVDRNSVRARGYFVFLSVTFILTTRTFRAHNPTQMDQKIGAAPADNAGRRISYDFRDLPSCRQPATVLMDFDREDRLAQTRESRTKKQKVVRQGPEVSPGWRIPC